LHALFNDIRDFGKAFDNRCQMIRTQAIQAGQSRYILNQKMLCNYSALKL